MSIGFSDVEGKAKKGLKSYIYKDGENTVRLFGKIVPRYLYWLKSKGKNIPVECLSFDRDAEKFTNSETDWVKHYFPEMKCSWGYAILCIDVKEGKVSVLNLKKKLFQAIQSTAEDLGDPTDPETGWDVVFKREKTGTQTWDVGYTLLPLRCKKRPLTEEELALIPELDIDEFVPRLSADQQKEFIEKSILNMDGGEETPSDFDQESPSDL